MQLCVYLRVLLSETQLFCHGCRRAAVITHFTELWSDEFEILPLQPEYPLGYRKMESLRRTGTAYLSDAEQDFDTADEVVLLFQLRCQYDMRKRWQYWCILD